MIWQVADSDLPDSPKLDKTIWITASNQPRPTKVEVSYYNHADELVELYANASDISLESMLPLPPFAVGVRVYQVRLQPVKPPDPVPGPLPTALTATLLPLVETEGDFTAINITVTNANGKDTSVTLQRLYLVVEDPTVRVE